MMKQAGGSDMIYGMIYEQIAETKEIKLVQKTETKK